MTMVTGASRPPLAPRVASAVAACVLSALGGAYYLTYEPAPQIGILWRSGISSERRAALEQRFLLVNPASENDRLMYDLLDTRGENIEALVHDPDVADTDRVSRERFEIPFDIPYGSSWMWVANRTSILRTPGIVPGIVFTCVVVLAIGAAAEVRRFRSKVVPM